jgi:hypothetical protein
METLDLFSSHKDSTFENFKAFHKKNPYVYTKLREMAIDWKNAGHTKVGIKMLFEVLRWQHGLKRLDTEEFALNNNYAPHYARLLIAENSELEGLFELRTIRSI